MFSFKLLIVSALTSMAAAAATCNQSKYLCRIYATQPVFFKIDTYGPSCKRCTASAVQKKLCKPNALTLNAAIKKCKDAQKAVDAQNEGITFDQ